MRLVVLIGIDAIRYPLEQLIKLNEKYVVAEVNDVDVPVDPDSDQIKSGVRDRVSETLTEMYLTNECEEEFRPILEHIYAEIQRIAIPHTTVVTVYATLDLIGFELEVNLP